MRNGQWLCECDCPSHNLVALPTSRLKEGGRTSCGCLQPGWKRQHPLYGVWCAIKSRCFNPNCREYTWYGAREITMHPAWRDSFEAFLADLPPKPANGKYWIDRLDNNGSYVPGNVGWRTPKQQAANRRTRALGLVRPDSILAGDTNLKEACRRAGVSYHGVYAHIKATGCTPLLAISHFALRQLPFSK